MSARARLIAVLVFLGTGALALVSSTQTWLLAVLADGAREPLEVSGAAAVPLLAPLSLTLLALGGALSISGRILRYAFGVIGLLVGGALVSLTIPATFSAPVAAVAGAVAEVTGLTGESAVAALVASITPTLWPAVTLLDAIIAVLAAVWILATAHSWPATGRRYRTPSDGARPRTGALDPIDSWDDLSHGGDPTARPLD